MTPSQSQRVLDRQINNLRNNWFQKQKEGSELIKGRDRPSKLKNLYQQILQLDDNVQKLVNKKTETLRYPDIFFKTPSRDRKILSIFERRVFTVYPRETNMTDQQNQTVQLTSDAEPTAAKNSQSVVGVSQQTVENGHPNKDKD